VTDYSLPFLKGVIDALEADSTIQGFVGNGDSPETYRIFSHVQQDTVTPYIRVFVTGMNVGFDSKTQTDSNLSLQVSCFSTKPSPLEAQQMSNAVYDLLHRGEGNITLDSGTLVLLQQDGESAMIQEPDGITWHLVRNFQAIID